MIGALYTAPWGRYRVHREQGADLVLQDLGAPSAFVVVSLAKLAESYVLAAAAAPAPALVPAPCTPPAPSWAPPPRVLDQHITLGAPIPLRPNSVPVGEVYWMPCLRRFAGDAHAWFVSEGSEVLCPACRGEDRDLKPENVRNPDPPPLEPDEAMHLRQVGAQVRAVLTPTWWAWLTGAVSRGGGEPGAQDNPGPAHAVGGGHVRSGASPAAGNVAEPHADPGGTPAPAPRRLAPSPSAAQHAELRCDDPTCGRTSRIWAVHDNGLRFCPACVSVPPLIRERMQRAAAAPVGTTSWKPPASVEERSAAKADVGSFDATPPSTPRPPAAAPPTRQQAWRASTKDFDR